MEVFVLLMSILLSSVMASAAEPSQADQTFCRNQSVQRDQYLSKARKDELLSLCLQSRVTATEAETLRGQITTLQNQNPDCFDNSRSLWQWIKGEPKRLPTAADGAKCDAAVAAKQAQLTELDAKLAKQQRDLAAAESKYKAENDASTAVSAERKAADESVKAAFTTAQLSIFSQKLQGADAALQLTKMATSLDNSAMGMYLRERMAGLLNSNALCEAAKACPGERSVKGSDLNGVFNGTMNTGVNSERQVTSSAPGGKKTEKAAANK